MSIMEVPGQAVESHPYRDRVDELLVKMERLIKQDIDDDTARLYNGGDDVYEICRISELPANWFESEDGIKDLEAGVALLQEIIAIQNDPLIDQEQKVQLLQPKLALLRAEYGV